jgi:cytochrome c-type biogenesis protein CcmH
MTVIQLSTSPLAGEARGAIRLAPRGGKGRIVIGLILLLGLGSPGFAVQPDEILSNPTLEARARALSAGLRCLVCQNQSIDDSDAPLARDLRILIREHLTRGESDAEITRYVTGRYGDFVLLKPRFDSQTLLLWTAPFAVLAVGGLVLWRRKAHLAQDEQPLSETEQASLQKALE